MTLQGSSRDAPSSPSPRASTQFEKGLVALIPFMRAFSRMLCGGRTIAEDLVQEALTKAWRARASFEPGTNMKAWVFTILRNEYYSHSRRVWRETRWDEALGEQIPAPPKEQEWTADLTDVARALGELPESQREAVILVAAGGFNYEDTAKICGAPVGSIKSRVARGRAKLVGLLDGERSLPRRPPVSDGTGFEDIQSQLIVLSPIRTDRSTHKMAAR